MTNGTHFPFNWTAVGVIFSILISCAVFISQLNIINYRLDNPNDVEALEARTDRLRSDVNAHGDAILGISKTVNLIELKIRYIERDINSMLANSVPGNRAMRSSRPRSDYDALHGEVQE